eukprot:m.201820 g.201820  ORF g.201820 m.201820 type:complete len:442 (-) comp21553_c0_seq1:17-1342(-)
MDGSGGAHASPAQSVGREFPGRQDQIDELFALMSPSVGLAGVNAIFVYGTAATGKSAVVTRLLHASGLPHAAVSCVEACSPRLLFEQVLWQLQPHPWWSHKRPRCDSLAAFIVALGGLVDSVHDPSPKTCYVVFDDADRLRGLPSLLPALLRLRELANVTVCPILISTIIWEKFRGGTGYTEPYLVHFPAYTKEATLEILALDCPQQSVADMHHQFCSLLFDVFHGPCRDLNELRHLTALLFPLYRAPVDEGRLSAGNASALYKNIAPHFKQQLSRLYLRQTSTAEWSAVAQDAGQISDTAQIELPFMSKHLVVAAYLASYNPASTDVRMFAKRQTRSGGQRASKKSRHVDKTPQFLVGPKPFPLERLLAILFSLMEARIPASAEVYSQLSSLVTLGLLSLSSGGDNLDAPRYKSMMTYTEVSKIAATLEIDLRGYLYETG